MKKSQMCFPLSMITKRRIDIKNKFKPIIAALMSFCILGNVTACENSNNDNDRTGKNSSTEYKDPEQKVYDENYYRNTELHRAYTAAACLYNAANTALVEIDEDGRMESVIKSSKAVIICSDKGKNVNASGVDDKFYEVMYSYFSEAKDEQWFVIVKNGSCEETFIKLNDCEFIGHKPRLDKDSSGNYIDEFDSMTFDEVYKQVVSENT